MRRAKRGPGRPPGSTSDTTRANILRSARICFALKGFGESTNRDIAERAGVTAPAIYQYFDSKVELYVTAAGEAIADVAVHMRAQAASEHGAAAALGAIVISLLGLHEKDPSLAAFLSAVPSELRRHPEIARRFRPDRSDVSEILITLVQRAVAAGELDPADAGRVAEMFIACMLGLSQYAAFHDRGRPVATAFAELLEGRLFKRLARTPRAGTAQTGRSRGAGRTASKPRREA
jgi:AcrR family transcriptional regulator